jgi:hypothetical protein
MTVTAKHTHQDCSDARCFLRVSHTVWVLPPSTLAGNACLEVESLTQPGQGAEDPAQQESPASSTIWSSPHTYWDSPGLPG